MNKRLKELVDARKVKLDRIDVILAVNGETRELSTEEQTEHNKLLGEIKIIDGQIKTTKENLALREAQEILEVETTPAKPKAKVIVGGGDPAKKGFSENEQRDISKYSFVRALRQVVNGGKLEGQELEYYQEGVKEQREAKVESNGDGSSLVIPQFVLSHSAAHGTFERRDTTATGTTLAPGDQGGLTIATMVGSLIDRLRNKLVMQSMGVTMLGGLQGNLDFPKVIADNQAVEKAENAVSAESSVTFSKISMSPRRLPIMVEVSRQLLMQSTVDIEAWLRNDMAFQIAQVMDNRAMNGNGSGQPLGILNTPGVGAIVMGTNGGVPTYESFVDMQTLVATLNADDGALGYLFNTRLRGKLKKTLVLGNTGGQTIWDRQNPTTPFNDSKVGVTNLMPSTLTKGNSGATLSAAIYGNFNDALMGQWGGLEFLVNPYSRDTEGIVRLNAWTFYDFILRRLESFAVVKDYVTV